MTVRQRIMHRLFGHRWATAVLGLGDDDLLWIYCLRCGRRIYPHVSAPRKNREAVKKGGFTVAVGVDRHLRRDGISRCG